MTTQKDVGRVTSITVYVVKYPLHSVCYVIHLCWPLGPGSKAIIGKYSHHSFLSPSVPYVPGHVLGTKTVHSSMNKDYHWTKVLERLNQKKRRGEKRNGRRIGDHETKKEDK
jgi:hypothetical protein